MDKLIFVAGIFVLGGYLALNNPEVAAFVTKSGSWAMLWIAKLQEMTP